MRGVQRAILAQSLGAHAARLPAAARARRRALRSLEQSGCAPTVAARAYSAPPMPCTATRRTTHHGQEAQEDGRTRRPPASRRPARQRAGRLGQGLGPADLAGRPGRLLARRRKKAARCSRPWSRKACRCRRKTQAVAEEKISEVTSKMTSMAGDVSGQGRPALGQARDHLRGARRQGPEQAGRAVGQGRRRADRAHRRAERAASPSCPRRAGQGAGEEGRGQGRRAAKPAAKRATARKSAAPRRGRRKARSAPVSLSDAQRLQRGASGAAALAAPRRTHASRPRIGLALAGGGPLGAIYEIGALCALDEALAGLDLDRLPRLRRRLGRRLHRRRRWPTA